METYMSVQPYMTCDEEGRTGLDKFVRIAGELPEPFGMQDMGERGNLDLKIEFIIAGMEHGLFRGASS